MRSFPESMWQLLAAAAVCTASAAAPAEPGHRLALAVAPHAATPAAAAKRGLGGNAESRPTPVSAAPGVKAAAVPAGSRDNDSEAEAGDLTHRAALVLAAVAAIGFVRRRLRG